MIVTQSGGRVSWRSALCGVRTRSYLRPQDGSCRRRSAGITKSGSPEPPPEFIKNWTNSLRDIVQDKCNFFANIQFFLELSHKSVMVGWKRISVSMENERTASG